ncbi:MAG TPA: LLM class flavin-dependent oxidoreductase, partial [Polyangiaceae bacterium]|nr:LLM class flavin-dependent oxidoreductase [Polyangiaceae bacterium]
MPQTKLGFVLIGTGAQLVACADRLLERGHRVIGVISDSEEAAAWTLRAGVPRIGAGDDAIAFVSREPYDYLLSIVNHAITSDALLATPTRGAINYHDSALPEYAGFNATAWSIADGQKQHAVTWHEMLTDVDSGRIFVQRPIPIGEDDTAFTLGVKCSEAGVETFAELLTAIESDSLEGEPQGAGRSFHFRSERPSVALLDWTEPAEVSHRLVRALTHGPDDNWMCLAKVVTSAGVLAVGRSSLSTEEGAEAAGTVLSVDDGSVAVRTADGVLTLHELARLDGRPLAADTFAAHGLVVGATLPAAKDRFDLDAIAAFDARVTKNERFWVRRLGELHPPALTALSPADDAPSSADIGSTAVAALPAGLGGSEDARATVAAAFGALVARLSDDTSFDLGAHVPAVAASPSLTTFYSDAVPLRFEINNAEDFSALRARLGKQLARLDKRVTFARDVTARYAVLRDKAHGERPFRLPVGLCLGGAHAPALLDGQSLVLALGSDGCRLHYDRRAIGEADAEELFNRFVTLLAAAAEAPETAVRALPLLTDDERVKLLETWQDTACDYAADRCMHQLFEAQVERTPDAVAVVFRDAQLTYRELNERANRVAQALTARGVETETLVGICVRRSLDMMVGLLGILKAGGAYVPMDPVYPKERLGIMLEDSGAKVLLTQRALAGGLPHHDAQVVCIDELELTGEQAAPNPNVAVGPDNLAYVIFTSGSTGRPKGVMVQHGNVSNFFTGMDARIGAEAGVLLAVTSISFDISVLELFWTLSRGFEVVIQEEADLATLTHDADQKTVRATSTPMDFGLFYFAADSAGTPGKNAYRLLMEGAKFADTHDFAAVWTPERHFHAFGGLYPNPAVTSAALAVLTENVQLRGGSVVLPLHNPLRVVEDWSVVDNLSGGRIELSFASGWHVNDFTFRPENYEGRREVMVDYIGTVRKLWKGEAVTVKNGAGEDIDVITLPRPVQDLPPLWLASAGSKGTFETAGRLGADILTNMLGQDLATLETNFKAYRAARAAAGHEGPGRIAVMLHTYVCEDTEKARRLAKKPFCDYLMTSFDLVKVAPWMFPAFKQPSKEAAQDSSLDTASFSDEDMEALLDYAFDRYFDTAGLFGSPERALEMVENLKRIGATECACLIDFGVSTDDTLAGLEHLNRLRMLANPGKSAGTDQVPTSSDDATYTIAEQLRRRNVTHMQCTPSMARMLVNDPDSASALRGLKRMMVGGEAFPDDLRLELAPLVSGEILNMYGPTETTIWSTTSQVTADAPITIGKPIANTTIRILDTDSQLVPIGTPGELCIGGAGVVRGYFGREDLTAERFVDDPYAPGERLYRTGDLARYRQDGVLEFLGRLDHQVKVNGYRIELGEIESVLARHSSVHQSVVVARQDGGVSRLVAYVVAQGSGEGDEQARINIWRSLWDEAYKQAESDSPAGPDPRFDYSGWTSSYDGALIAREQMSEWLDGCANRILDLAPERVLEIGCGTGMILYRVMPEVQHYTAVDLSPHALSTIEQQLTPEEAAKTTLVESPAHELDRVSGEFDTVVINSVCQYFPSADYLTKVLSDAASKVADGGRIFVGDVRSAAHERLMMTALEMHQAPGHLPAADLRDRVERRLQQQSELLLSARYFEQVVQDVDRISAVEYQLKRGTADNEMTRFRYDVVLHVGTAPPLHTPTAQPTEGPDTLDAIRALLASEPAELWLTDVPNQRLTREADVMRRLASDADASAQELLAVLEGELSGVNPEALFTLDPRYTAQVVWAAGGDVARMDVVLRHRDKSAQGRWPFPASSSDLRLANEPSASSEREALIPDWQTHLRDYLPEYMMPGAFVVMDALPLTPNGKIDRKALPAPQAATQRAAEEYVAPANQLEQTIAQVWREMLNLEQVGIHSNIFDLGANSLLTVQANNRLNRALGQKVSLVAMF